jgi:hypothetical protein
MGVDRRHLRRPSERNISHEAFEEQAAERVDVGTTVDLITADLLGGDVVERAEQRPVRRLTAIGNALRSPKSAR